MEKHPTLDEPSLSSLVPIMAAVFVGFLVIGLAMPVLPLHVHDTLGQGAFLVGLIAGSQFAVALLSRPWAGWQADSRGAKWAVIGGLLFAASSGIVYLLSLLDFLTPGAASIVLLVGRALLGTGESLMITGAQTWGLQLVGPRNTGRVLAWMGTAMYGAFALGAPVGSIIYDAYGFVAVAVATLVMPLLTLIVVIPLRPIPATTSKRGSVTRALTAVWRPGLGAALSSVGFGAMIAFSSVLFASNGWPAWTAFSTFAVCFMAARILFGQVVDLRGPTVVAVISVVIEAAGLILIASAPSMYVALIGSALTGLGYSLVYPAFGVVAVRSAPASDRGLAMGAYTAFLDLALGTAGPLLGLLASGRGLRSAFIAGAVAALASGIVALWSRRSSPAV